MEKSAPEQFSARSGIPLSFSAPVSQEALEKAIVLTELSSKKTFPIRVEASGSTAASTEFNVFVRDGSFQFETDYTLALSGSLLPAEGNLPLGKDAMLAFRSRAFIADIASFRKTYSASGELTGTPEMPSNMIASNQAFLHLWFDEEVDLAQGSVWLTDPDGVRTDCNLSYLKTEIPSPDDIGTGTVETDKK